MTGTDTNQLPGTPLQVFLSYARLDLARAEQLREQLVTAGFAAYLDKHDILPGEPWQARLARLIENADAVVFLVSPDSVSSAICDWEINEAERLHKRIVPVVIRDLGASDMPGRLKRLPASLLRDHDEPLHGFAGLRSALRADVDWLREHTRLGGLAAEWSRHAHVPDLLLRGQALSAAEQWLAQPQPPGQAPTDLHRSFITASRQAEVDQLARQQAQIVRARRLQRRIGWALGGVALLLLAGGLATALGHHTTSRRSAELFASKAQEAMARGQLPLALRYAVAGLPADGALPLDPWSPALERLLADLAPQVKPVLATLPDRHKGDHPGVLVDPGLDRALVLGSGEAVLWDTRDGRVIRRLPWDGRGPFHAQLRHGRAVAFDGSNLRILDADSGVELASHGGLAGHRLYTNTSGSHVLAVWSRPSETQGAVTDDAAPPPKALLRAFAVQTGQALPTLAASEGVANPPELSPDGSRVAFLTEAGVAQLADLTTGKTLLSWPPDETTVLRFKLFPDGSRVLAIAEAGAVLEGRVYDARDGQLLTRIAGIPAGNLAGDARVGDFTIAEQGDVLYRTLAQTASADAMPQIQVWDLASGAELLEFRRSGCVQPMVSAYSTGQPAVSRAAVVCQRHELISPLAGGSAALSDGAVNTTLVHSPRRDRLAVGDRTRHELVDSSSGQRIGPQPVSDGHHRPLFSPDGARLLGQTHDPATQRPVATLRDAGTGTVIATLAAVEAPVDGQPPVPVDRADFSADGRWLLTQHGSALVLHDGQTGRVLARPVYDPRAQPRTGRSWFAGRQQDRLITSHVDGSVRLWNLAWQHRQGRALVDLVCRQLLQGPQLTFSAEQMQDPILDGRADLRAPCDRLGPLRWAWWLRLWQRGAAAAGAATTASTAVRSPADAASPPAAR